MAESPEWTGFSEYEEGELREAVAHGCECEYTDNILVKRCSTCAMLLDSGRMAHLLFARRLRAALMKSEHVIHA